MLVAEAVGRTLAGLGVDTVFGVVGSGNFHVTNALVAAGGRYVAARHECGAATMADAYARTWRTAVAQRRTVVLNLPLDVQAAPLPEGASAVPPPLDLRAPQPSPASAAALAEALRRASRPVFIAGRGARVARARASLERLADTSGALLATSAVAKGMFNGNPWYL